MSYFNNIEGIGSLEIDYIFFETNYPVFFSCKDKKENLYLCVCCDIREEQRWIISKTTVKNIIDVLTNHITLRKSLENNEKENYIVTWSYKNQKENSKKVDFSVIDTLDLPTEDEYLDADEGEFNEYILNLKNNNSNIFCEQNINSTFQKYPIITTTLLTKTTDNTLYSKTSSLIYCFDLNSVIINIEAKKNIFYKRVGILGNKNINMFKIVESSEIPTKYTLAVI